jgi:hypothetical protein
VSFLPHRPLRFWNELLLEKYTPVTYRHDASENGNLAVVRSPSPSPLYQPCRIPSTTSTTCVGAAQTIASTSTPSVSSWAASPSAHSANHHRSAPKYPALASALHSVVSRAWSTCCTRHALAEAGSLRLRAALSPRYSVRVCSSGRMKVPSSWPMTRPLREFDMDRSFRCWSLAS